MISIPFQTNILLPFHLFYVYLYRFLLKRFLFNRKYVCRPFNTPGAVEQAKRAVEQHYAVVGVLEDMNTTLTVLEHYIPKFFTGASDIYNSKLSMKLLLKGKLLFKKWKTLNIWVSLFNRQTIN